MLSYNLDGSGIELVERGEVFRRAAAAIEIDFDQNKIESRIHDQHMQDSILYTPGDVDRDISTATVISDFCAKYKKYAILSHTWLQDAPGEVTYANWKAGKYEKSSAGYDKIERFCRCAATEHKLALGWMDTICINKESSAELDESIRSMYNWYKSSTVCITYLSGTTELQQMHNDRWFTRGWTLQELIAPRFMAFYSLSWKRFIPEGGNDKRNRQVTGEILQATSIDINDALLEQESTISKKMGWAAVRQVTREEDTSYSLMGLFRISMPTAYGEGAERAFIRLVREVLKSTTPNFLDIVNHGYGPDGDGYSRSINLASRSPSALIPRTLQQYRWRERRSLWGSQPLNHMLVRIPITLSQLGLQVRVLVMPGIHIPSDTTLSHAPPRPFVAIGSYFASASVNILAEHSGELSYNILDARMYDLGDGGWTPQQFSEKVCFFAVLNFMETEFDICIPPGNLCMAVVWGSRLPIDDLLPRDGAVVKPMETAHAVAFKLNRNGGQNPSSRYEARYISIRKSELEEHGMYLRTLYM